MTAKDIETYKSSTTQSLCMILIISEAMCDYPTVFEVIDVLRERHPEVRTATMKWAQGNDKDEEPVPRVVATATKASEL